MLGIIAGFVSLLLLPLTMVICGAWFLKSPPDIQSGIGYRTTRSLSSAEAWLAAHRICGRLWLIIGIITLVITILCGAAAVISGSLTEETLYSIIYIFEGIQLALFLGALVVTEIKLKEIFHN